MDLLMHTCAEPKPSVMLQAYSLKTVLPKHLMYHRRQAEERGSLPVPLSPGSVVLDVLPCAKAPGFCTSQCLALFFSLCSVGAGDESWAVPLQGICPLQDIFFAHPPWMETSTLCVFFYSHCCCFCHSFSEVSPAVHLPTPSSPQRPPSHQCSQQMMCPWVRTWRILLWYVYPGAFCS